MLKKSEKTVLGVLLAAVLVLTGGIYAYRSLALLRKPVSATDFYLDTVVTVSVYDERDEKLLEHCMELCGEYEQKFSRTLPDSEISRLNRGELRDAEGWSELSDDTAAIIAEGLRISKLSGGAFDLTIGAVSSLWDFTENRTVPEDAAIQEALTHVGWEKLKLEGNRLWMPEGTVLDLGGIAKGWIADRMKEYLVSEHVDSAILDLGGNILCIGQHPGKSPFRVGVRRPFAEEKEGKISVVLEIDDRSVVTSGIDERYFEQDGQFYHHILDPKTGYPCESDLISVTIVSDSSMEGDALSTACFVLGLEKAQVLLRSMEGTEAVFIDTGDTVRPHLAETPYQILLPRQ